MTRLLSDLPGPTVAERLGPGSIVVVPTGAVEHHGPHLPLSTDLLIAEAVTAAAVDLVATEGIDVWRLPPLAFTKSDEHAWAPGTVWLDWDTMFETCCAIGRAVQTMGAGSIVFSNGHGGNIALLQVVLREIRRRTGLATFLMPAGTAAMAPEEGDELGLSIHGGAAETALVWHLRPELVRMDLAVRSVPPHLAEFELLGFNGRPVSFGWLSDDFGTAGVIGDPTLASPEFGARVWDSSLTQVAAQLREIARFRHRAPG